MKVLYTLFAAGMLAVTTSAQQPARISVNGVAPVKVCARTASSDLVVTEIPDGGVTKAYVRSSELYQRWASSVRETKDYGAYTQITEMPDGQVYMTNPMAATLKGCFVGTKQGDKYVFDMPQYLSEGSSTVYEFARFLYKDLGDGQFEYIMDQDSQDITYTVNADGTIVQNGDSTAIIGITDDNGGWYGYGEYNQVLVPAEGLEPVEVPASAERLDLSLTYDAYWNYGVTPFEKLGGAALDGNDLYVKGLFNEHPDAWVKGVIEDGKVVFTSGQYLGLDAAGGHVDYFMTGEHYTVYDEMWDLTDHFFQSLATGRIHL